MARVHPGERLGGRVHDGDREGREPLLLVGERRPGALHGVGGGGAQPQGGQHGALDLGGEQPGGDAVARYVAEQQRGAAVGQGEGVVEVAGQQPFGGDQVAVHGRAARAGAGGDQQAAQADDGLALLFQGLAVALGPPALLLQPHPDVLDVDREPAEHPGAAAGAAAVEVTGGEPAELFRDPLQRRRDPAAAGRRAEREQDGQCAPGGPGGQRRPAPRLVGGVVDRAPVDVQRAGEVVGAGQELSGERLGAERAGQRRTGAVPGFGPRALGLADPLAVGARHAVQPGLQLGDLPQVLREPGELAVALLPGAVPGVEEAGFAGGEVVRLRRGHPAAGHGQRADRVVGRVGQVPGGDGGPVLLRVQQVLGRRSAPDHHDREYGEAEEDPPQRGGPDGSSHGGNLSPRCCAYLHKGSRRGLRP